MCRFADTIIFFAAPLKTLGVAFLIYTFFKSDLLNSDVFELSVNYSKKSEFNF